MRALRRAAIGLAAGLLAGCAGADFERMGDEALVLGQTRPAQVTARLGRPFRQSVLSRHGKEVQVASYSHASARAEAALEGAMPARVQNFYFADGRLVGHEFASSFRDDSTDFDLARAARIRKGATTRAGVLYLLGAPAGRYIYPMTAHAGEEAFVYLYSHVTGQGTYRKALVVSFDARGVVSDAQFEESRAP